MYYKRPGAVDARSFVARYTSAIFVRVVKIISPLNSANLSTSGVVDNINFPDPILGVFDSPFGVIDI